MNSSKIFCSRNFIFSLLIHLLKISADIELREEAGMKEFREKLARNWLKWAEHVERMEKEQ